MKHMLALQFKGERNYVHATSIFDSIIALRRKSGIPTSEIDFSMRRFTTNNCYLTFDSNDSSNNPNTVGDYRDTYGNITILDTQQPIIERIAYHESAIISQCDIHEKSIDLLHSALSFSFIEKTIAAYKALLQNIFGESGDLFFFIRLYLDHIPTEPVTIIYDRLISKKYFQGSILVNHKKIGSIYFGVKKI